MADESKTLSESPSLADEAKPAPATGPRAARAAAPGTPRRVEASTREVIILVVYYLVLLLGSFWFLFDVWSSNFRLMRWVGVTQAALEEPLLRTIGFTITGGFLGSILYQIRVLFHYYAKETYDSRWFGKYITAPWEGAGMAMVVLSLIRGGVTVFGGSTGTDVTAAGNFAAFGTGALVGFGMRDVVGWLGNIIQTMFTIRQPPRGEGTDRKESRPSPPKPEG